MQKVHILVRYTGLRIPNSSSAAATWLGLLAERAFSWAQPTPSASEPFPVPLDVIFEPLYLGCIPATALSMAGVLAVALVPSVLALPLVQARLLARSHS